MGFIHLFVAATDSRCSCGGVGTYLIDIVQQVMPHIISLGNKTASIIHLPVPRCPGKVPVIVNPKSLNVDCLNFG